MYIVAATTIYYFDLLSFIIKFKYDLRLSIIIDYLITLLLVVIILFIIHYVILLLVVV